MLDRSPVVFTVVAEAGSSPITRVRLSPCQDSLGSYCDLLELSAGRREVTHIYANNRQAADAYDVSLTVFTEDGPRAEVKTSVLVTNVLATLIDVPEVIDLPFDAPLSVTFSFTDPGAEGSWYAQLHDRFVGETCLGADDQPNCVIVSVTAPGQVTVTQNEPYTADELPAGSEREVVLFLQEGEQRRAAALSGPRTTILMRRPDNTEPEISYHVEVDGQPVDPTEGWYTGDGAMLVWSVVENESVATVIEGCVDVPLSDVRGGTFTCVAISRGGESSATATINYDNTRPVVEGTVTGNEFRSTGWYTGSATVVWKVTDNVYPVVKCADETIDYSTGGTVVSCSATSPAGTAEETESVKVDATKPDLE